MGVGVAPRKTGGPPEVEVEGGTVMAVDVGVLLPLLAGGLAGGPVTGTETPEEGMGGTWPDVAVQRTWNGRG